MKVIVWSLALVPSHELHTQSPLKLFEQVMRMRCAIPVPGPAPTAN